MEPEEVLPRSDVHPIGTLSPIQDTLSFIAEDPSGGRVRNL
jgi:hypothetical protein